MAEGGVHWRISSIPAAFSISPQSSGASRLLASILLAQRSMASSFKLVIPLMSGRYASWLETTDDLFN